MANANPYGSDLSLLVDLDAMGAIATGRLVLSQALVRRWSTPAQRLLDDPHYGYDVTGEINDDLGPSDVAAIGANMDAEAIKDQRVVSCLTQATFVNGVLMTVSTIDDGNGPFTLTLAISAVSVTILTQNLGTSGTT
jgi:hypothetical protein